MFVYRYISSPCIELLWKTLQNKQTNKQDKFVPNWPWEVEPHWPWCVHHRPSTSRYRFCVL